MSNGVLFKGNMEEGSYKLIKTTDGWVLVGKDVAFAGSDITDRPQGEWKPKNHHTDYCSNCGFEETQWRTADYNYCPSCGARMKGVDDEHTV